MDELEELEEEMRSWI